MQLSEKVSKEIKNYIMNLLGRDAFVIGMDGICLASPDPNQIGSKIELQKDAFKATDVRAVEVNKRQQVLIPLEYQKETIALLLLNEKLEKLNSYISLVKSFAELLIQQYYENNKPIFDTTDQFITKLVNNASRHDWPLYESEAKVLGYDLSAKRVAIVIHLDGFWEKCLLSIDQPSFERDEVIKNAKRSIENTINGFFSRNNDVIIAYLGSDKFAVFKAVSDQDQANIVKFLKKSYKSIFEPLKNYRINSIAVGFGEAYSGIEGLVTGFREADLSLELGQKLWGKDKGYYFGDLGILTILGEGNREKNVQFANQMLDCMHNKDLNETLECFFDQNLNLTETAEELGVHRNTIIYRLNQISKILGADPRVFDQAMTIKIALLIRRLFA
ncbi:MAG: helix-turn-helix domain-containing protein [Patescibacteria group bacterium]